MKKLTILSVLVVSLLYSTLWFIQEKSFMVACKEEDTVKAAEIMKKTMFLPWHSPFACYCLAAYEFHNGNYLGCIFRLNKLKIKYPSFLQSDFLIAESWLFLQNEPRAVAYYLSQTVKQPLFEPSFIRIEELYPKMSERIK